MADAKHTPTRHDDHPTAGEWEVTVWEKHIFVSGGPNRDDIAEFNFSDEHTVSITRDEAIANATLFAASKDLLAALQELVAVSEPPERNCSCHLNPPCGWCVEYSAIAEAHEDARAAIARATVTP